MDIKVLEGQLRECYGRAVYSHKTHEKCADILLSRLALVKRWQIILSAAATGGFITTIVGGGVTAAILGALVSGTLLVLNAYTKDYDLGELAQKHKQAANDIWLVREQYLSLLTDLRSEGKAPGDLLRERDRLVAELHSVYAGSPSTNSAAYKKAQEGIQKNQEMTFSDQEIDSLLPESLRSGG